MKNLEEILKKRIIVSGPLSISDFISETNLNKNFGYYNKNLPYGKDKDFITAPEISQMFGEIIALWAIDCWNKMGKPKNFNIIELGPGSGTLMNDFLRTINSNKEFVKNCNNIFFFEASIFLKKIQKKNINKFNIKIKKKIKWINNLNKINKLPFILIANEFFDALPIKQIEFTKTGWRERMINYDKKKKSFHFSFSNNETLLEKFLPKKSKYKIGSIYEIPIKMMIFIDELFKKMKKEKSTCLIIDYVKNKTFGNSLKSIKKQKITKIFDAIGNSDISSHVNFNLFEKIAKKNKLNIFGPINQRNFLINIGILYRAKMLMNKANNKQKKMILNNLDFLINNNKMGEIFHVISISNKNLNTIEGFNK